jgi:uncharacterized protein YycO
MRTLIFIISVILLSCNSENSNVSEDTLESTPISKASEEMQTGDLIFHTSKSSQSKAIQIATNSKYSHMGLILKEGSDFFVLEAVQPVKLTRFEDWIDRGENGDYIVKRLKDSGNLLTPEAIDKMKTVGEKYLGKDYDLKFEWSDDKIYCSELVWKIYKEVFKIEIGSLEKFEDFDLSDDAVQQIVDQRYGEDLPLDELIITPDRMFKSDVLTTVIAK